MTPNQKSELYKSLRELDGIEARISIINFVTDTEDVEIRIAMRKGAIYLNLGEIEKGSVYLNAALDKAEEAIRKHGITDRISSCLSEMREWYNQSLQRMSSH